MPTHLRFRKIFFTNHYLKFKTTTTGHTSFKSNKTLTEEEKETINSAIVLSAGNLENLVYKAIEALK